MENANCELRYFKVNFRLFWIAFYSANFQRDFLDEDTSSLYINTLKPIASGEKLLFYWGEKSGEIIQRRMKVSSFEKENEMVKIF